MALFIRLSVCGSIYVCLLSGLTCSWLYAFTYAYNLAVDPTTSPDFRYVGKPREGHTKLEIRFKKGLPAPVTVILYATFPEIMTIDQARNVRLEIKDKFAQRRERN